MTVDRPILDVDTSRHPTSKFEDHGKRGCVAKVDKPCHPKHGPRVDGAASPIIGGALRRSNWLTIASNSIGVMFRR